LSLGPYFLSGEARLEPEGPSDTILLRGRRTQGILILKANQEALAAIEEVGIEDYLLGVLPYEMDPSWPLEALKAQAVVARSFAYSQLGKYRRLGYDLTSDTRSQLYRGRGEAWPRIRRAVEETRGEVMGYRGRILPAYYHACCGGHTTDAASVWGAAEARLSPPPLRGVRDRFCRASPHARWSAYFEDSEILAALQGKRLLAGPLRRLEVALRDAVGYVKSFRAQVGSERLLVGAGDLRRALGNGELRSLRIARLSRRKRGVEFAGSGSGHGVGLCQWGARLQAEKGRRYEQILRFYFPGSLLSVLEP